MSARQKFQRRLARNPQLLTCNSYLNFLRSYKSHHPRYGLRKILKNGFTIWNYLTVNEKKIFKQKNYRYDRNIRPRLKWPAKRSLKKVPRLKMPNSNARRQLQAKQNIKRRKRNIQRWQRYRPKNMPIYNK